MSKVSIVMPSLNVANYINECLNSVVSQTLRDIEIICVDAGSCDGTYEVIEEYARKDNRIKIISSDKKSYGRQVNLGIQVAKGDYIAIVETDDFILENMYEELYDIAQSNELDFVKCDHWKIKGPKGRYYREKVHVLSREYRSMYGKVLDRKLEILFAAGMHTWSGIYKRDFLISNNIYHNETPGASYQDNGFWFQTIMNANRVMFLDKAYYCLRRDNPDSSFFAKDKIDAIKKEFDFIHEKIEESQCIDKYELYNFCYYWRFRNYVGQERRITESDFETYFGLFRDDTLKALEDKEIEFSMFHNRQYVYICCLLLFIRAVRYESDEPAKIYTEYMTKFIRARYIYIYGAGKLGGKMYEWLKMIGFSSKVKSFIVTNKSEDSYMGIVVDEISNLRLGVDDMLIVSVGGKLMAEIKEELSRREINKYFILRSPF